MIRHRASTDPALIQHSRSSPQLHLRTGDLCDYPPPLSCPSRGGCVVGPDPTQSTKDEEDNPFVWVFDALRYVVLERGDDAGDHLEDNLESHLENHRKQME